MLVNLKKKQHDDLILFYQNDWIFLNRTVKVKADHVILIQTFKSRKQISWYILVS